jgi:hypothetical protein
MLISGDAGSQPCNPCCRKRNKEMRILLICNKSPYPSNEGGPMAMDAIIRGCWQQDMT